jgi:hypothetical protein
LDAFGQQRRDGLFDALGESWVIVSFEVQGGSKADSNGSATWPPPCVVQNPFETLEPDWDDGQT